MLILQTNTQKYLTKIIHTKSQNKQEPEEPEETEETEDAEDAEDAEETKGSLISDIKFCPYHPKALIKAYKKKSGYRKPGNLMIKQIVKKWKVNIKKSFMLGDRNSDKLAAKKSNLYYEHVKDNFYNQIKKIDKKIASNY